MTRRKDAKTSIKITFTPYVEKHYGMLLGRVQSIQKRTAKSGQFELVELSYELRDTSERILKKELGADFFPFQLFIPAGRSFFTNAGKAVLLLEQGNMVDPFIARFGRLFASARDRALFIRREERGSNKLFDQLTRELLGGVIKQERSIEYLESKDGRKIPFMVLSSGQQELLPLVLVLRQWGPLARRPISALTYIEEPEAHLFPSAQAFFVELIALMVNASRNVDGAMMITTHSPYVLAKLNNLIKAGQMSTDTQFGAKVEKIVPQPYWLTSGVVTCYGIHNGQLKKVMDPSGLIDAEYLDDVSGNIAEEFNSLLAIEYPAKKGASRG